jgi:hypothetical protein
MPRMTPSPDCRRRGLLLAALGFARLDVPSPPPALVALRTWLGSWPGIGAVAAGMARQGYDLSLTRYAGQGWRATFFVAGTIHSATGAVGSGWERTPWQAVQRAAWDTLVRGDLDT